MPVHKKRDGLRLSRHSVSRAHALKILVALLLTILLFLCTALLSHTTKTFAVRAVITVTLTETTMKATATPRPTPKPSPTIAPTPTPKATPIPTATSIPTVAPSPTVVVTPTMTHPTPVVTQKAGLTPLLTATRVATVVVTQPTTAPIERMQQGTGNATSSRRGSLLSNSPLLPLVVGTLLTLCLGAVGFVGVRRARTALLPAIGVKKQRSHAFAHSWQRVRPPAPVAPSHEQETLPFSSIPELQQQSEGHLSAMKVASSEGPKTGTHRRLGPVRLQTIKPVLQLVAVPQGVPREATDMPFLDDPQLQNTLRHYRQKRQKQDE